MKKNIITVILLIFVMLICNGCSDKNRSAMPISSNKPKSSQTPPVNSRRPEHLFQPPIVLNDPLLDLSAQDFEREYAKLPDDYKIEIGIRFAEFTSIFSTEDDEFIEVDKSSHTITKRQAEQIRNVNGIREINDDDDYNYLFYKMSLKGLRYFPNIKSIVFESSALIDISELGYLTNLEEVRFWNCSLGMRDSTDELRCLTTMKKVNIDISRCKLKNLNFLKYFSNLNGSALIFDSNKIKDISPLINLKKIAKLSLAGNQIKDISPLSNLKEVQELELSNNRISDISPLANLKKADEIWLGNNVIRNFGILAKLKEKKRLKKYHVK